VGNLRSILLQSASIANTIATLNFGSYYDIKTYNLVSRPGKQVLQWAFLALGPTIAAFKQCRPVICIDGTGGVVDRQPTKGST
jgi:hypothetical protein